MAASFATFARAALLALFGSLALSACKNPCLALAEEICACAPNRAEEDACNQSIKAARVPELETEDLERCDALIERCTCDAIEDGDLAACGLSKEGANG